MTVDTTKLRELAQAATPGPWRSTDAIEWDECVAEISYWHVFQEEGTELSSMDNDAEYIAAANPATVLALLDEIDKLRTIEAAARNLVKVKGRHHSEQAMNQLLEALK